MNSKAALGLTAGALAVGLVAGLALGGDGGGSKPAGPGPTKTVDGVPVGFQRSKEGAVAAASTYARILSETLGKGAAARHSALAAMSLPEREDVLMKGEAGTGLAELDKSLEANRAFVRLGILGQELSSYGPSAATVRLWTVSVVGRQGTQGQASWGAGAVELRWTDGDWKLWNTTVDPQVAVVPALVGSPSSADEFVKSVAGFREIDDVGR